MQNLDQKDNIFVLQNTIEQSIKGKSSLSFKFVDLEKAQCTLLKYIKTVRPTIDDYQHHQDFSVVW